MDAEPAPISLDELGKLIRILGLLGSEHAGERAAAALKAVEWLQKAGTSWEALLVPPPLLPAVVSVGASEEGHSGGGVPRARKRRANAPSQPGGPSVHVPSQAAPGPNPQQTAQASGNPYAMNMGLGGLGAVPPTGSGTGPAPVGQLGSWQACAQAVLAHYPNVLRGSKEQDFVSQLLTRGYGQLTPKQAIWLQDICARAGVSW